jgi:predicted RNA binding protein YcfA (HicA-like mRNA interferase family)
MFKVMKTKDLIKEVERAGFTLIRNSDHKVFQRDNVVIMLPHSKTTSSGLVHQTYKTLKSLKKAA